MTRWVKVLGVVVLVWLVAGAVIFWSRSARPTARSLSAYMEAHTLEGRSEEERQRVIRHVATQLNRFDFQEREELRKLRQDRRMYQQMTPNERREFIELTLPQGLHELMRALNAMSPEERKRVVNRALRDLERDSPELAGRVSDADVARLMSQGISAFYDEASAEVKLDFAPVIERLQRTTQGLR